MTRHVGMLLTLLAISTTSGACGRDAAGPTAGSHDPASRDPAAPAAPEAPPLPASARILGVWRYEPPDGAMGPTIEIEFTPEGLRRAVNGRHEVLVPHAIREEGDDYVVFDMAPAGSLPATRHRWRLLDGDRVVHEAAPTVVYGRAAAGRDATTEGSR